MPRVVRCVLPFAAILSACSNPVDQILIDKSDPPPVLTLQEPEPAVYHASIQAAIDEIPGDIKPRFQKFFLCEMKRNNASAHPQPVTPTYIRELTAYLAARPEAFESCSGKMT